MLRQKFNSLALSAEDPPIQIHSDSPRFTQIHPCLQLPVNFKLPLVGGGALPLAPPQPYPTDLNPLTPICTKAFFSVSNLKPMAVKNALRNVVPPPTSYKFDQGCIFQDPNQKPEFIEILAKWDLCKDTNTPQFKKLFLFHFKVVNMQCTVKDIDESTSKQVSYYA